MAHWGERIRAWEDEHAIRGIAGYRASYALMRPWLIAEWGWLSARWFVQRGRRGYSDADVWGLTGHLDRVLAGSLVQLAAINDGCPLDYLVRFLPEGHDPWDSPPKGALDLACETWRAELRATAAVFAVDTDELEEQAWCDGNSGEEAEAIMAEHNARRREALLWLADNWRALWD